MNWTDTLLGETRSRLLALLRRSRQSVAQLAGELGISANAVRTHLAAMQRDRLVQPAGLERATGGKPAQLYDITPQAEELFPKAYSAVLSGILQLLEEHAGRDAVVALLREVGVRAGSGVAEVEGDVAARVEAAAAVLRQLGGDVDVERGAEGWVIRGYGCPLSGVVADHAEVCALAEALVGEVSGLPVRACCAREGRPQCGFWVGEAQEEKAGRRRRRKEHRFRAS